MLWGKIGFSKGTLHYMKQNAKNEKPFTLNALLGRDWRVGEKKLLLLNDG
ncbi:hypothetical protein SAMN04488587_0549 [Methanococcoides vulcani]|uniref:Uncharacterized protein n=1 Tax=Methanococcoides vulcani TaxID=1353158 RepID=A0A1H9YGH7_9EURY|nr:hypothetical protein SAMN04488587_0549 [Methanococcoides vulcani]